MSYEEKYSGFSATVWERRRVQLLGALLFAVFLPGALTVMVTPELYGSQLWTTSLAGACITIVASNYFFHSLIAFPGTRWDYQVLPVYTASFGTLFAALLFARLEYSRPLLVASYLISMVWQFVASQRMQAHRRLAFAVAPFGRVEHLYDIRQVRWRVLKEPMMPRDCRAIVADFSSDLPPEWEQFLADAALKGIPVIHYKQLRQTITGQVEIEHLSENANGTLVPSASFLFVKMVVDFAIAVVALVLLFPVMILIAILIRLDSPGPALFSQQRVGYRGRSFRIWKFRTMEDRSLLPQTEGNGALDQAKTVDSDPRVTGVGRFLRQSRLDEIPQIFNILRGEMSWIGPRPEIVVLSKWYQSEIPFYRYRHIVRPGISGWAQVNQGHVAELGDISHKLNFDFYYISNFSLWLDVLIIVRTVRTMINGFGAR